MPIFDITKPYDTELVKGGAWEIRNFKEVIKLLLSNEHTFPNEGENADDKGVHKIPQRCMVSSSFPNLGDNPNLRSTLLYNNTTRRLYYYLPSEKKWYPANALHKRISFSVGSNVSGNPYVYSISNVVNVPQNNICVIECGIWNSHSNWQYFELWLNDIKLGYKQLAKASNNTMYGDLYVFYRAPEDIVNGTIALKVYSSDTAQLLRFVIGYWIGKTL